MLTQTHTSSLKSMDPKDGVSLLGSSEGSGSGLSLMFVRSEPETLQFQLGTMEP